MANTYPISFESKNLLSKVKLGNDVYYVKDADLRAIVAQFGNAADQSVAASIAENGTGLVTSAQVYSFVKTQMHTTTYLYQLSIIFYAIPHECLVIL